MIVVDGFETHPAFERIGPATEGVPVLFNSPHSGHCYPQSFLDASRLDELQIRRSEDTDVDLLFERAPLHGAAFMRALFPRAFLDVNREPYELDPSMFDGRLPPYANIRSLRVAVGLGTIARIVSESEEIYAHAISVEDGIARIENIYKPYHAAMRDTLGALRDAFGHAVLIDCHSMPSLGRTPLGRNRPDFILGDRYGTSCSNLLVAEAASTLSQLGYSVGRNKPYAGGFITEHYGRPSENLHALQIEVNRGLYLHERTYERSANFEQVRADLDTLIAGLCQVALVEMTPSTIAAE